MKPIHLLIASAALAPFGVSAVRMNCYQDFEHADEAKVRANSSRLVLKIRENHDVMAKARHDCTLSDDDDVWNEPYIHGKFLCRVKTNEDKTILVNTIDEEIRGYIDGKHGHIEKDPGGREAMAYHGHIEIKKENSSKKRPDYEEFLFDCYHLNSI